MRTILIVEDEVALLESLVVLFEMHDYKVITATNGNDAIKLLSQEEQRPKVIVCDINLPDVSGYEVLKYLRSHEDKYRTPFIFLSAYADKQDVRLGMDLGADDYITKPFSVQDLLNAVSAKLTKHKNNERLYKTEIGKKWAQLFDHNFRQEFYEPLNIAINASRMCLDNIGSGQPEIADAMTLMIRSCYRMFRNSRNLVLNSSLHGKELTYSAEEDAHVDITAILNSCLSHYNWYTDANNAPIKTAITNGITCSGSTEMLEVIFTELIDNAVKFATNEAPVVVLRKTPEMCFEFSVTNTVSFTEQFTEGSINPFTKFHSDASHHGFGLGLYIVKELCLLLGYGFSIGFAGNTYTAKITCI